jgi:hypothetical protein
MRSHYSEYLKRFIVNTYLKKAMLALYFQKQQKIRKEKIFLILVIAKIKGIQLL